jgi:cytidylate kinase
VDDPDQIAEWASNIATRDHLDSTRADSPLVAASDAVVLDTSEMTIDEVVTEIVRLAGPR